jgi:hypothetical protein
MKKTDADTGGMICVESGWALVRGVTANTSSIFDN